MEGGRTRRRALFAEGPSAPADSGDALGDRIGQELPFKQTRAILFHEEFKGSIAKTLRACVHYAPRHTAGHSRTLSG